MFLFKIKISFNVKIVIFAHQNWGVRAISELIKTDYEISFVFTHPLDMDKNETVWYDSVKKLCDQNKIPVDEKINISKIEVEKIKKISPDLILSVGWRRLLPNSILSIPKYGSINMHDGLIPKYRGFAPINWAIINGETEAGITTHFIDAGIDTGSIIMQKKISINFEDTAYDVYNRLLELSSNLLLETLSLVDSKQVKPINQTLHNQGFFCSRRFPSDGRIDWANNRLEVYNLIRALSDPYPNAFCYYHKEKVLIKQAKLIEQDYRGPPGRICSIFDSGIVITCGKNYKENQALLITKIGVNGSTKAPNEFFTHLWENLE